MESVKIALLGEIYELFSVRNTEEISAVLQKGLLYNSVFLMPSLSYDFLLKAYSKRRKEQEEYYTAALCAAAFLVKKRGLPLSEISFETPSGNIEVFCTGSTRFSVNKIKCKQLLSYSSESHGCEIKWRDLLLGVRIRALHADDISTFKKEILSEFVMSFDAPVPAAVLVSGLNGAYLEMKSQTAFSAAYVSNLLLYSAAAYCECLAQCRGKAEFVTRENLILTADASSVSINVIAQVSE